MTELEVTENRFFVLKVRHGKEGKVTLHSDIDSPVRRVKDHLKTGANPDDIELLAVEIKEENFEIKGVPWSAIAVRLVQEK